MKVNTPSLKSKAEVAVVSIFGLLFRYLPCGPIKVCIKRALFDRYLGWRNVHLIAATNFGANIGVHFPDGIQTAIFLSGVWEPNVTKIIAEALGPGEVFIDVGANIGYYSLLASYQVGLAGRVYAFEASPRIFNALVANIERNGLKNVDAIHRAVSNFSGSCQIFLAEESNLGRSTIIPSVARSDGHKLEAIVDCDTLRALIPSEDLLRARFIKIDIEGAERFAIEGVLDLLPNFSYKTEWLIEMSPRFTPNGQLDVDWIFDAFIGAGYSAFVVENDYSDEFVLGRVHEASMVPITSAPKKEQSDVIFSRSRTKHAG